METLSDNITVTPDQQEENTPSNFTSTSESPAEAHNYDITDLSDLSGLNEVCELINETESAVEAPQITQATQTEPTQPQPLPHPTPRSNSKDTPQPFPSPSSQSNHLTKTPLRPFELLRYENTRHSESPAIVTPDPTSQVLLRKRRSVWSIS